MELLVRDHLPKKPWYRRGLGQLLVMVGSSLLAVAVFFGASVAYHVWKITKTDPLAGLSGDGLTQSVILTPDSIRGKDLGSQDSSAALQNDGLRGSAHPSLGSPNAALTIVEFADFGCPFSREASFVLRELAAKYPTRFHYIYRDFPILDLHPEAKQAAEAARCAGDQGKFWAYHDKLYANQNALDLANLARYADQIGLDSGKFKTCLDSQTYSAAVEEDFNVGVEAGIRGTPTFFFNGKRVEGVIPVEKLEPLLLRYAER